LIKNIREGTEHLILDIDC